MTKRHITRLGLLFALVFTVSVSSAAPAAAAPAWGFSVQANTTARPGSTLTYYVEVRNVGDGDLNGSAEPMTFSGTIPRGLTLVTAGSLYSWDCSSVVPGAQTFSCQNVSDTIPPLSTSFGAWIQDLTVQVTVDSDASGPLTSRFQIAGGDSSDGDPLTPAASGAVTVNATNAAPVFGIAAFDAQVAADAAGTPYTQAGGHPFDATTWVDFQTANDPDPLRGDLMPVEAAKDVDVDLPPGFFGDPSGVDQCTVAQLANTELVTPKPLCSPTSQVGVAFLKTRFEVLPGLDRIFTGPLPLYNLVPPDDKPARFGFNAAGVVVTFDVTVRSGGDYGLTSHFRNISEGLASGGASVTLWGDPAAVVHRPLRACPGIENPIEGGPTCDGGADSAFLRNPTACTPDGVGLPITVRADSWVHPGVFDRRTIQSHLLPGYSLPPDEWGAPHGPDHCESVPFDPTFSVGLESTRVGSPTGLAVDLTIPQTNDPKVIGQSDLRKTVLRLPAGLRVNPSSAAGLGGCSSTQIGLDSTDAPACPGSSKIGEVEIKAPALKDPLEGSVYLATPFDNKFGSLLAIYITASGSGVQIKLAGKVEPDPVTGQLTTTFDDSPQAPFSSVHVDLKGGPNAPLTLPNQCGTYNIQSQLTGWSGKVVNITSPLTVDQSCDRGGFNPQLTAGTKRAIAGATSPFSLRLTREDTDQELSGITAKLPPGITGYLKGLPYGSQVGNVTVGAGSGPLPFYVQNGRALLEGPYKGAPLSLLVSVPAVAGPFDLGVVNVRAALHIDPTTGQITTVSDPLPTILQGIPLDVRDVRVNIDRDHFTLNPTSCEPMSVDATVTSTQGAVANPSDHFQVTDCAALGFKPKLGLKLFGKPSRGAHPALRAVLAFPKTDGANLARASVALPHSEFLDQAHIRTICTRVQFAADACPKGSIYGYVKATSPLVDYALRGPVYLRSSSHKLPDMVLALRGPDYQPIEVDAVGRIDSVNGGIRSTFESTPDLPIDKVILSMKGGAKGLIQNSRNVCAHDYRATANFDGQNGKVHDIRPLMQSSSCGAGARTHKRHPR